MKKIYYMGVAVAFLVACDTVIEPQEKHPEEEQVFTLSFMGDAPTWNNPEHTRHYIDTQSGKFFWEEETKDTEGKPLYTLQGVLLDKDGECIQFTNHGGSNISNGTRFDVQVNPNNSCLATLAALLGLKAEPGGVLIPKGVKLQIIGQASRLYHREDKLSDTIKFSPLLATIPGNTIKANSTQYMSSYFHIMGEHTYDKDVIASKEFEKISPDISFKQLNSLISFNVKNGFNDSITLKTINLEVKDESGTLQDFVETNPWFIRSERQKAFGYYDRDSTKKQSALKIDFRNVNAADSSNVLGAGDTVRYYTLLSPYGAKIDPAHHVNLRIQYTLNDGSDKTKTKTLTLDAEEVKFEAGKQYNFYLTISK